MVYVNKVHLDDALPAVNFTLFNAIGLALAGADTHLFVQVWQDYPDGTGWLKKFGFNDPLSLSIHQIPDRRFFGIKSNQWFYLRTFRAIRKLHKSKPVSAVISRDPGALPYLVRLKKRLGIPVFYQPHNFYLDLSLQPDINPKNATKYHRLETTYLPGVDGLLCLQEAQADWYRRYLPDQQVVASRPGLVSHRFSDQDRLKNPLIGYSGSLQLKKGIRVLLQALRLLHDRGRKVPLVLIGGRNSDEIIPVQEEIATLGLTNAVTITGWIPFPEVEAWLDQVTIGVLPLTTGFYNQYLTAPNKLFDYLSHGIPVVASDLPSVRDFFPDGVPGDLVPPDDSHALAAALESLLNNPDQYNFAKDRSRQLALQYHWKNQGAIMLGHLTQLILKKSAHV